jgi:Ca2+:H+ antiporter
MLTAMKKLPFTWLDVLLLAVPVAVVLEVTHASPGLVFAISALGIVPLAGWMGRATEHLAARMGPAAGGLLNATFGNAAELIIAVFALRAGHFEVVKASLTGSIIGNVLLVLGLSLVLGGMKHKRQKFNRTAAGLGCTLLLLSAFGLLVPALYHITQGDAALPNLQPLSLTISVILFVAYLLSLLFQLITHQHLFAGDGAHEHDGPVWSRGVAVTVLLVATALVAVMAEFLVGAVDHTAESWGMSKVFVGVILVAIVGNAAEHSTAVLMAMKNKMDLALNIAVGSGIQIALFVAPLLVFLSYAMGPRPMSLEFTALEVAAVLMSVLAVKSVALDGESHWMEGVLLLAVYAVLAVAFWFV